MVAKKQAPFDELSLVEARGGGGGGDGDAAWRDDDGRPRRTGTVWTASAHIITAVIGSGVLSLAWAIAQLGWAAGPAVMLLFAVVIYYTSALLAECYRSGDPVVGKRNYTYMDAVRASLGGAKVRLCGAIQYANLFGVAIGYTIAASISMLAIKRADCFHAKGHRHACRSSSNPYMILFGVAEVVFSQIPDFDQIWWLSIVAAAMSFTYATIGLALGIAQTVANGGFKGSLTGVGVGDGVTPMQKVWRSLQAFGDISFAYSAVKRADCFHVKGHRNPCRSSSNPYMILFGAVEVVFSQIPDFDQIWWLSIVAAVMSFTYSTIGLVLGIVQTVANGGFQGSLTGISISATVTPTQKVWRSLQAFGNIAFAYSYSIILIEIQDTVKAPPPSEAKVMKRATMVSVATTTVFYMLCGCMGYAAFGDAAPDNLLTGFGFYEPFWLLDVANVAIVVHLVGAYQVFCQPLFAFVEKWAATTWPDSAFIARELTLGPFNLSVFRLIWRTAFVCLTTVVAMLLPFFGDVVGLLGAVSFWPLTVYFPIEMYVVQRGVRRGSTHWVCLQMLSAACLVVSVAAAAGSIADVIGALKVYRPFSG